MTTDIAEPTDVQPKKIDGRTKEGKAAKAAAKAAAEQAQESVTPETMTPAQIQTVLDALVEANQAEPQQAEQPEPQQPSFDVSMSMFAGGKGANLFAKPEHQAVMEQIAAELRVQVKLSNPQEREDGTRPDSKPYISVQGEQVQTAIDKLSQAGLTVNDARPRFQERQAEKAEHRKAAYIERQQAQEALRFEGAGSLLIQASQRLLETGRTFVEGQELNVYQTKDSIAEQAKIAELRAAGQDIKDKPIEIGIWDKRTETVVAKGTVGRDAEGKVAVHVSIDNTDRANSRRPDNKQLILPTREKVLDNLQRSIEQRATAKASLVKPKDKAAEGR